MVTLDEQVAVSGAQRYARAFAVAVEVAQHVPFAVDVKVTLAVNVTKQVAKPEPFAISEPVAFQEHVEIGISFAVNESVVVAV